MKRKLPGVTAAAILLAATTTFPVYADSHGKGGPASSGMDKEYEMEKKRSEKGYRMEQQKMDNSDDAMEERERDMERERDRENDDNRGMEKQRERVMEQEQKELGKGSEQGQESREQRRKWWRFWE
jgi:hypothetical protein